jgi:hypothetical protein
MHVTNLLGALLLLILPTTAQFQFFEHMFGGNQHHQQQQKPQNMGSDSAWYQQQYEAGITLSTLTRSTLNILLTML